MNRLIWISGMAVLIAFLVANIANLSSAYGCTKNSTDTNQTNSSVGVNNGSGVSTKPSALTSLTQISIVVGHIPCNCAGSPHPISGC